MTNHDQRRLRLTLCTDWLQKGRLKFSQDFRLHTGSSHHTIFGSEKEKHIILILQICIQAKTRETPHRKGVKVVDAKTFGEAVTGDFIVGRNGSMRGVGGFFDGNRSAPIPAGTTDAPVGASVYLVMGDGADLASSTDFAVFDPGLVFGTENAVGAGALDIIITSDSLTADSLVYGTIVPNVDTGLGLVFDEAIQLGEGAVIPEPSTSLLAALAGLALAARRRR